jgi:hypothetical protein
MSLDADMRYRFDLYARGYLKNADPEYLGKIRSMDGATLVNMHRTISMQFGDVVAVELVRFIVKKARAGVDAEALALADRFMALGRGRR